MGIWVERKMTSKCPPGFCKGRSWEADSPAMDKHGFGTMSDADVVCILTSGRMKGSGEQDLEIG